MNAWLKENGISAQTTTTTGGWLSFEVPVSKANELFDADFSVFKHDETGTEAVRTLSYSIPTELQGHLDFVHPTVTFPNPNGRLPVIQTPVKRANDVQTLDARAVPSSCSNSITPACLQALYNIPLDAATQSSNKLGVTGYDEQDANAGDLAVRSRHSDLPSSAEHCLVYL